MAVFREVEVWPNGGFANRRWAEDPDEDAFARRARTVCEAYSQALPQLGLMGKASLLRISCHEYADTVGRPRAVSAPPSAAVEVDKRFIESFESGHISVMVGFADLSIDQQLSWTLDVVHEAVRQLAQVRGWDPTVLELARRHAEAQGSRFVWEGPWKSAPDRRHRARGTVCIGEDGMGRAQLEVVDRTGQLLAQSEQVMASCDGADLIWTCKTVKWHGPATVAMAAIMDPYGLRQSQLQIRLGDESEQPSATIGQTSPRAVRFHPPGSGADQAKLGTATLASWTVADPGAPATVQKASNDLAYRMFNRGVTAAHSTDDSSTGAPS